jgi:uncharacterized membrane protein
MRVASVGHAVFAAMWIAFGIVGLVRGDFTPVFEPVARDFPAREILVYGSAAISLGAGLGLLWRRFATIAARVLLASLVIWLIAFRVRDIVRAPSEFGAWDGCAETAVLVAGAWVLSVCRVRIARTLYGIAMVPFGVAHLIYVQETATLVPGWLPWHVAWAYVTGIAFLAAGAAVLVGIKARLAAALSAAQMGAFTLLVWVPLVATGSPNAFQWHELGISAALAIAGWVVADSYGALKIPACTK